MKDKTPVYWLSTCRPLYRRYRQTSVLCLRTDGKGFNHPVNLRTQVSPTLALADRGGDVGEGRGARRANILFFNGYLSDVLYG